MKLLKPLQGKFAHRMCSINPHNFSYSIKKVFLESLIGKTQRELHFHTLLKPTGLCGSFPLGRGQQGRPAVLKTGQILSEESENTGNCQSEPKGCNALKNQTASFIKCFSVMVWFCVCALHTHIHKYGHMKPFVLNEQCISTFNVHTNQEFC